MNLYTCNVIIPPPPDSEPPGSRVKDMTAWSLWQKMPPRYQLTTRCQDSDESEVIIDNRPRSPKTRHVTSPRLQGDKNVGRSPRVDISGMHGETRTTNSPTIQHLLFPGRKSGYIDHIKTQQRVNTARIRMATDPSSATRLPRQRAKTAPLYSQRNTGAFLRSGTLARQYSRDTSESSKHESTSTGEMSTKIDLTAHGIGLDDDRSTSGVSWYSHREIAPRKFTVRETDEGTLYMDNGKVVLFRKPRHNGTDLMRHSASSEKGGFLASIRREYLNKPRHLGTAPKTPIRPSTSEARLIQRERVNYDKKVGHILDYYSIGDQDQISMDDISRYTSARGKRPWRNAPETRILSPRVRKIYLDESPRRERRSTSPQNDAVDDPNAYLKLSSQSKLHDRKFFLRTPGFGMLIPGAQGYAGANFEDNCKCGMCRIEMQISLLAQLGIHFPVPKDISGELFMKQDQTELPEHEKETDNKTVLTELNDPNVSECSETPSVKEEQSTSSPSEVPSRLEQTLTITLPEMTSERETTDLSTRDSARETYRSVPGD